jgi:hypothetical protein
MLTRTGRARDLAAGGLEISAHMLGKLAKLQVHHIFPQARLYEKEFNYSRGHVNAIANFCFLTQDANLEILDRLPEDYFKEVEEKYPGALESQWIPLDPELRKRERYLDFLAERRTLLAKAANEILDALIATPAPDPANVSSELSLKIATQEEVEDTDAKASVEELVESYGLASPSFVEVVVDPLSGDELGMADFLWLDGLQGGYDDPVLVTLEPEPNEVERMTAAGYHVLQSIGSLEAMLKRRSEELIGSSTFS